MDNQDLEREYEEAIIQHSGLISKICYCFSSDSEEFKDLRQEVLYNIWKGWSKFRYDSKISTWIYRVSFNTCITFQRKARRRQKTLSLDEVLDIPSEPDSQLLIKYNTMHRLIQKLGYEDRAIILMWLDEKSYEEIAELIGINRNTLAVRLKRIKEKLVNMSKQ